MRAALSLEGNASFLWFCCLTGLFRCGEKEGFGSDLSPTGILACLGVTQISTNTALNESFCCLPDGEFFARLENQSLEHHDVLKTLWGAGGDPVRVPGQRSGDGLILFSSEAWYLCP